jgi:hypothetical protein
MCIFFTIHELMGWDKNISSGKRNTRVFMLGVIVYCMLYIFLINLWDKNLLSKNMSDALFWCGIFILFSDISIMAFIYKNYYGRSIINELDSNNEKYIWDEKKEKYYKIKNFENFNQMTKNNKISINDIISKSKIYDDIINPINPINHNDPEKITKSSKSSKSSKLSKSSKSPKSVKDVGSVKSENIPK